MPIYYQPQDNIVVITMDRPDVANAIDRPTARELADAMRRFDADETLNVAVLTGANGTFCAGADLKAMREPGQARSSSLTRDGDGPVGPTRLMLKKPVIAAVEGHAVAGGLEIAMWCDLRVAAENAVFGVYCRRWGIPLMDGGTIRLTRMIGQSNALDMILTGRGVSGKEAAAMGLANRLVAPGATLDAATELARSIAGLPQAAIRSDRMSAYEQWSLGVTAALENEYDHGMKTLSTGEMFSGLDRYASGGWRETREGPAV
jgi:enoyl-CoA hydratase